MSARQIKNIQQALAFWATIDPEDVVKELKEWQCGTQACFGGHLAQRGMFGIPKGSERPEAVFDSGNGEWLNGIKNVSQYLFRNPKLFSSRGYSSFDDNYPDVSDHELVRLRLEHALAQLQNP